MARYSSIKSETSKVNVPSHGYFKKLEKFSTQSSTELYIEFVKGGCEAKKELCDFCKVWIGPKTGCVPRPYPDKEKPGFHYLAARVTPVKDDKGEIRPIDDFQPRAQLKQLFEKNAISSSDENEVKEFSAKYIVPENLVRKYILHLEHLEKKIQ